MENTMKRKTTLWVIGCVIAVAMECAHGTTHWVRVSEDTQNVNYDVTWTDDGAENGQSVIALGGNVCVMNAGGNIRGGCGQIPIGPSQPCNVNVRACLAEMVRLFGTPWHFYIPKSAIGQRICLGKAVESRNYPWNQPSTCFETAPPPVTCHFDGPVPLAHGQLQLDGVSGSEASSTTNIVCSGAKTVTVRAIRSSSSPVSVVPVRADESISSSLTVNGMDGATGASINVPAGQQPVPIRIGSRLSTTNPTAGALAGNAVLTGDDPAATNISENVVAPPVTCRITPLGTLDHKTLLPESVPGNIATTIASLACSGPTTVTVQAIRSSAQPTATVPLRVDESIRSSLTVNGVDGATGARVVVPSTAAVPLTLVSTLSATNPTAGALKGVAQLVAAGQTQPISIIGDVKVAPAR
jgi:hypothetical protein